VRQRGRERAWQGQGGWRKPGEGAVVEGGAVVVEEEGPIGRLLYLVWMSLRTMTTGAVEGVVFSTAAAATKKRRSTRPCVYYFVFACTLSTLLRRRNA